MYSNRYSKWMVNLDSESDLEQLNCLLPQRVDGAKWPVPAGLLEKDWWSISEWFICVVKMINIHFLQWMIVGGEVQVVVLSDWLFVWVWEMRGRTSALISLNPPGRGVPSRCPTSRGLPSLWYTSQGPKLMLMILKVSRHLIDHHDRVCIAGSWYQHMQGTDKRHLWILMSPCIVSTTNQFALRPSLSSLRDGVLICG